MFRLERDSIMGDNATQFLNRRARRHRSEAAAESSARRWASIQGAAKYLGVTDRTVRNMIADGRLTGYRCGGRLVRVDLNEVDAAMEAFGGGAV